MKDALWKDNYICTYFEEAFVAKKSDKDYMINLVNKYIFCNEKSYDIDDLCSFFCFFRHRLILRKNKNRFIPKKYISIVMYMENAINKWTYTSKKHVKNFVHKILEKNKLLQYHIPHKNSEFILYRYKKKPECVVAIHRSAILYSYSIYWGKNVVIGKNCQVLGNTYFGSNVTILDNSIIGKNNYIGDGTFIGKKCIIHRNSYIGNYNILTRNVNISVLRFLYKTLNFDMSCKQFPIKICDDFFEDSIFHTVIHDQNFFNDYCSIGKRTLIMPNNIFGINCKVFSWSYIDSKNTFLNGFIINEQSLVVNLGKSTKIISNDAHSRILGAFSQIKSDFVEEKSLKLVDLENQIRILKQTEDFFRFLRLEFPRTDLIIIK
ncbi:hypothetical protein EDEG_02894 [Edhazardia aedis USNM 41457]|uniref:Uncharacterized protein n=1 Tax=Edhazardia aedis (strain USNM 41457) TaxID=1003232 RepID=J9DJC3_EDHAE|nr:hypothetical protein EDEG_02894 [Edhazardia aedis USNM 41457]|eukprot:EJW02710.1 hypothetical protein EDEG_02894 [Edhazardia aedis USNM 41457]